MKFIEKLKAALKLKGLSEDLAKFISIESEDQIDGVVNQLAATQNSEELDFTKILATQEFEKYVTDNGFDKVLEVSKKLKSEHDKKVTSGIKSFRDKHFKTIEGEGDEEDLESKKKKDMQDQTPEWAKNLIAKVDNLEKEKTTTTKLSQAKEAFANSKTLKKLPKKLQDNWLKRINLESETSFDDQIKELEEEVIELKLVSVDSKGLPTGGAPSEDEPSAEEVDSIVDAIV